MPNPPKSVKSENDPIWGMCKIEAKKDGNCQYREFPSSKLRCEHERRELIEEGWKITEYEFIPGLWVP